MGFVGSGITVQEVQAEVEHIRSIAGDAEAAHSAEDVLWERVLCMVAAWDGMETAEVTGACREALKTRDIKFPRWYA